MRQSEFERQHAAGWERFERWLQRQALRTKTRRKLREAAGESPDTTLSDAEVPASYRALCSQLALARERRYAPGLVARLDRMVLAGHHALYGAHAGQRLDVAAFLGSEFPRLVRSQWRTVALASLLFFGPLLGMMAALELRPDLAAVVLSPQQLIEVEQMYDAGNDRLGQRDADEDMLMFGFYIWNNVRIGFQTFAGGVLFGLGSLFFLLYNGIVLGTVVGHLTQVGLGPQIWSFVAGHSALELVAIAISGAAGFKLGLALLHPGQRSRRRALVEEGRVALRLMGGAAVMFLVAAAVEAFWSPLVLEDPRPKYLVGVVGWILLLGYLVFGGRSRAA